MALTRRRVLIAGVPATILAALSPAWAGVEQGLEQFGLGGPPCAPDEKPTPAVPSDGTFRSGSPRRTSLVEPGATGTPLAFAGTVTGLTCGRIAGARVDVWHADVAGRYDGSRFRGHQLTDAEGRFQFRTIVPGPPPGRAPHLGLNVVVTGKADFWTELFLPDHPRNASDPRFQPALVLTMLTGRGGRTASFDVILDI